MLDCDCSPTKCMRSNKRKNASEHDRHSSPPPCQPRDSECSLRSSFVVLSRASFDCKPSFEVVVHAKPIASSVRVCVRVCCSSRLERELYLTYKHSEDCCVS